MYMKIYEYSKLGVRQLNLDQNIIMRIVFTGLLSDSVLKVAEGEEPQWEQELGHVLYLKLPILW